MDARVELEAQETLEGVSSCGAAASQSDSFVTAPLPPCEVTNCWEWQQLVDESISYALMLQLDADVLPVALAVRSSAPPHP